MIVKVDSVTSQVLEWCGLTLKDLRIDASFAEAVGEAETADASSDYENAHDQLGSMC